MSSRNSKKLYAIKKTKTGRNSVVQVVSSPSKGMVYASTGRKLASTKKTFKTKAAAQKHLKTSSSFGRKKASTKRAPPGQGYIACVNPTLDEDKPNSYFKVFKVYTYKVGDEKIRIFNAKTESGAQQYWTLNDENDNVKVRKTKAAADKDRIKLGRLRNANIDPALLPVPCNPEYLQAIGLSDFFGGEGGVGQTFTGGRNRVKLPPAYAQLMGKGWLDTKTPGSQVRIGKGSSPSNLEQIFGNDPTVLGASPDLFKRLRGQYSGTSDLDKAVGRMSNSSLEKAFRANTTARLVNSTDLVGGVPRQTRRSPFFQLNSDEDRFNKRDTRTPSMMMSFGSIPTFGRYAYPVDPALKRLTSSFGYRPRQNFGRINYGFSRYF